MTRDEKLKRFDMMLAAFQESRRASRLDPILSNRRVMEISFDAVDSVSEMLTELRAEVKKEPA